MHAVSVLLSVQVLRALKSTFVDGAPHNAAYKDRSIRLLAVNPKETVIEAITTLPTVKEAVQVLQNEGIAADSTGLSIITPPAATSGVIGDGLSLGVRQFWCQPGAESAEAKERVEGAAGATLIAGGPCVLVELGFHDDE